MPLGLCRQEGEQINRDEAVLDLSNAGPVLNPEPREKRRYIFARTGKPGVGCAAAVDLAGQVRFVEPGEGDDATVCNAEPSFPVLAGASSTLQPYRFCLAHGGSRPIRPL